MNDREAILRKALEKYRLTEPASPRSEEHTSELQSRIRIVSLRRLGRYNPFTGMVTACYFASRRMGFGLTMAQSLAACLAAVLVSAAALSAGFYGLVRLTVPGERQIQRIEEPEANEKGINTAGEADEIGRISFEPLTDLIVFNRMIVTDVPAAEADRVFGLLRNSVLGEMEHLSGALEARKGKTLRTRLLYSGDMYSLHVSLVRPAESLFFPGHTVNPPLKPFPQEYLKRPGMWPEKKPH
jgi:hypothetical protein